MKLKFSVSFLVFYFASFLPCISQNRELDSLKQILKRNLNDSIRMEVLLRLSNIDTSNETAMEFANEGLALARKTNSKRKIYIFYNTIGNLYGNMGHHSKALEAFLLEKKAIEEAKLPNAMINVYLGLGNVYMAKEQPEKALANYLQALDLSKKMSRLTPGFIATIHANIGQAYAQLGNLELALEYFHETIKIETQFGYDGRGDYVLGEAYAYLADVFTHKKEYEKAVEYYNRAKIEYRKISMPQRVAYTSNGLGSVALLQGNMGEAERFYQMAITELGNENAKEVLVESYKGLAEFYSKKGDYKNAYAASMKFSQLKDSILNEKSVRQMNQLSAQYESEKKDKELLQKESEIKMQQADTYRKSIQRNFFIAGFGVMILLSFLILRSYRQKKKANEEISIQKHLVEEKQKEILDSIHYAKRIQKALLASKDFIDQHIPESFVLFKPKDIVSGDFYWASRAKASTAGIEATTIQTSANAQRFYLAICDSTGHGVPGAFMSLLNIGFLTEAINEKNIFDPSLVFNHARQRLIESISREGQKDGFDGILFCLDPSSGKVTYAAANNAPVLVSNGALFHLDCNKMPVGQGEKTEPFNVFRVEVKKGDMLYCYTDGYADQFGGPKGKKFKYRQLDDLLLSIYNLPVEEQREILEQRFQDWKGDLEQVDDVCVIGLRF